MRPKRLLSRDLACERDAVNQEMDESIQSLIEALVSTIPMEIRTRAESGTYLEAVVSRQDLERCVDVLRKALGEPAKAFDQPARFDRGMRRAVERLGGIRDEQCLFLKPGTDQALAYAALWPWESDSTKVTLKIGTTKQ